jgi:O-antigen/teichoic acid export membrane protein
MSRTRNAVVAAGFTYLQFAVAVVSGFVLVPFLLRTLGARNYGLWLATGEALGYAGMLDVGVLAILPWLVAQADGRRDPVAFRGVLSRAVIVGAISGACVAVLATVAWAVLPGLGRLTDADLHALARPLLIVVAAMALTYPARAFNAVLVGLQDVTFVGWLALTQTALSVGLTVGLLVAGYGLDAVAVAAAVPPGVTALASYLRLRSIQPDVLRDWPWPDVAGLRWMVMEGAGAWTGGLGWTMVAATSGLVITFLGHPEAVVVYACTAKLSQLGFQLSRVLPDSGLVALAQIDGEGRPERVRAAVVTIVRLHLLLGGAAALAVLVVNPLFVTLWVGARVFGGVALTIALAGALVFMSLTHGLACCTAVLGRRRAIGAATLVYGLLTVVVAGALGRTLGLPGVAVAPVIAGTITTLPIGILMLGHVAGISGGALVREVWTPWLLRLAPLFVALSCAQAVAPRLGADHLAVSATSVLTAAIYAWWMRPVYQDLPLHPRLRLWLGRMRLGPPIAAASIGEAKPWA